MEQLGPISETLDTEVKSWLDLDDPRHAAILARACIALRNNGGGRLILGIGDASLRTVSENRPPDLVNAYHADRLNACVGKYALPKFEVRVENKEYEGQLHPEITVLGGVSFPVISRAPFDKELRQNAVYVRTISNGRPASCEPKTPQDWERLIQICFDNREADIGRFFRRHLGGIVSELHRASPSATLPSTPKDPSEEVRDFLKVGRAAFEKRREEKSLPMTEGLSAGSFEVAALINGNLETLAVRDLLNKVFVHQPHMTGWPTWVDSRSFRDSETHPYVRQGGWEAMVNCSRGFLAERSLDFWRIEPNGRFYLLRSLEDDTASTLQKNGVKPGTVLDFLLVLSRTTEAIGTIRAIALGLNVSRDEGAIDFAFRWSGLKGRQICCWVEPGRSLITHVRAEDESASGSCRVPLDIPDGLLWQAAKQVVQPVFDVFGAGVGDQVIQDIVERTLTRRL